MRRDWTGAAAITASIGYEATLFTDVTVGHQYLGFREKTDAVNRGWGSYYLNLDADRGAVIEVPHPKDDLNTPELAAAVFRESGAQALLMAGSDRHVSDAANDADDLFTVVHRAWNGIAGERSVWQLHGYAAVNHPEFPIATQAVISSGAAEPSEPLYVLDDQLESAGFKTFAFNRLAYNDPRNVLLNQTDGQIISGTVFAGVGATLNIQGQYTRTLPQGKFVHIELETGVRVDAALRAKSASAIATAIRSVAADPDASEIAKSPSAQTILRSYLVNASGALETYSDAALIDGVTSTAPQSTRVIRKVITRERLVSRRLEDGSVAEYDQGRVTRVTTPGGLSITDVELSDNRTLTRATLNLADGTKLVYSGKEIIEEVTPEGAHIYFENGLIRKLTNADGYNLAYDYDLKSDGSVAGIWVRDAAADPAAPAVRLKYGADKKLLSLNLTDVLTKEQVVGGTSHVYEGGDGSLGVDGDFETWQYQSMRHGSGGIGTVTSEHRFPTAQTLSSVTFRMYAYGRAGGNYTKDYEALYYVEALRKGAWIQIPGSFRGTYKVNGSGSYTTPTDVITLNGLNLSGVTAVRAVAHGFGNSSDGGNADGGAGIFEFQWQLAEQANYTYAPAIDASGRTTGHAFAGYLGTIGFDAGGALVGAPTSLAGRFGLLDGRIAKLAESPFPDYTYRPSDAAARMDDARFKASLPITLDAILSAETVVEQEFSDNGDLETQSKADKSVTLYNAAGKPEAVLNGLGEKIINYTYDADGNLEKVDLIEARRKLPDQIGKVTADIAAQRAESLHKLSESKALAIENIKQSAADARTQAQGYMGDLQSGMNSLGSTKVKGKQGKKAKSDAMDQYRDAMNQIQSQIVQIDSQEAEAYERLDNEVQSVSQQILANAQIALTDLRQQEKILQNEILRQETTPVVFDVYRRILGRDPSGSDYQKLIDRLDYEKAEIVTESVQREVLTPLPSVTFDGSGDYLMLDDPYRSLTIGTADFLIDLTANIQDIDRNQTLLDIGGWREGLKIAYQGSQRRLEWHVRGAEYGVWSFTPDSSGLLRLRLERKNGVLTMSTNGVAVHQAQNASYISAAYGVRVGLNIDGDYGLRGALASLRVQSAGTTLLDIAPAEKDEFVKDLTGNHTIYNKGDAALNPAKSWLTRSDTVTEALKTEKIASVLKRELLATAEYQERTVFVSAIKSFVRTEVPLYRTLSESDREAYARSMGLAKEQLIRLTDDDTTEILDWIESGSLHFGQSAFNAMDLLLKQEGRAADKLELAKRAILIDILTGVISPLDEGDLVISMFALKKTLALSGVASEAMKLGYNDLQKIYDDNRVLTEKVTTREYLPGSSVFINQGGGFARFEDLSRDADFGSGNFTVEAWVNHTGTGDFYPIASKSTNPSGWIFFIRNNELGLYSNWNVGNNSVTVDIPANTWNHVAVSREGNTLRYFVNGKLAGQKIVTGNTYGGGDADIMIGSYNGWSSQRFHGRIDEFKATRKALYTEDFATTDLRSDPDASVAAQIRVVDDGQGLLLKDISQRHRIARIEGTVTLDSGIFKTRTLKVTEKTLITRGPPDADLKDLSRYNPKLIAHISGNHFIVIKDVTDTSVTYIDTSIGPDAQNEVVTLSKDEFLKIWQGHILSSETIALKAAADHPQAAQILTDREAQSVRGAGLIGSILGIIAPFMNILIPGSGLIFTLLSAAVNAIEGDFISAIASIATLGFGGFAEGFKGLFGGITQSLGSVGQMISNVGAFFANVFSPVTGFFSKIATNLHAFTNGLVAAGNGAIAGVVQTAVSVGVNLGVSKGLEVLGVSPEVSSLLGSFATGAISGVMEVPTVGTTMIDMVQKNVLMVNAMYQGFQLGTELGLAPEISQILSLGLGAITGDISPGGNATNNIAQAFKNVMPNITSSMTQLGISNLGDKIGIDNRYMSLIGAPISSMAGASLSGKNIVQAINQGVISGAASLAMNYVTQATEINPLLASMGYSAIGGMISGLVGNPQINPNDPANGVSPKNILEGASNSLLRGLSTTFSLGGHAEDAWSKAQHLQRITSFQSVVNEQGLLGAIESYAGGFFQQSAIEEMITLNGTVQSFMENRLARQKYVTKVEEENRTYKYIPVTSKDDISDFDPYADENTYNFIKISDEEGNLGVHGYGGHGWGLYGSLDVLNDRSIGLGSGNAWSIFEGSTVMQSWFNNEVIRTTQYDQIGNVINYEATKDFKQQMIASKGQYADGSIEGTLGQIKLEGGKIESYKKNVLLASIIDKAKEWAGAIDDAYSNTLPADYYANKGTRDAFFDDDYKNQQGILGTSDYGRAIESSWANKLEAIYGYDPNLPSPFGGQYEYLNGWMHDFFDAGRYVVGTVATIGVHVLSDFAYIGADASLIVDDFGRAYTAAQVGDHNMMSYYNGRIAGRIGREILRLTAVYGIASELVTGLKAPASLTRILANERGSISFSNALVSKEDDLWYGLNKGGALRFMANKYGGKLLQDFDKPVEVVDWYKFSVIKMEDALARKSTIRFKLDDMDQGAIFNPLSEYYNGVASKEVRYLKDNWSRFKDSVVFVKSDKVVNELPWSNT